MESQIKSLVQQEGEAYRAYYDAKSALEFKKAKALRDAEELFNAAHAGEYRIRETLYDKWHEAKAATAKAEAEKQKLESEGSGLIGKRVYRKGRYQYGNRVEAARGVIEAFNKGEGLYPVNMKYGLPGDGFLIVRLLKANGERSTRFDSFSRRAGGETASIPYGWEFDTGGENP